MEKCIIAPTEPETIEVYLTKEHTPVAYERKIKELLDSGAVNSREDAEGWLENVPFQLELIYDINSGLFALESAALESNICYSPYSRLEVLTEFDIINNVLD